MSYELRTVDPRAIILLCLMPSARCRMPFLYVYYPLSTVDMRKADIQYRTVDLIERCRPWVGIMGIICSCDETYCNNRESAEAQFDLNLGNSGRKPACSHHSQFQLFTTSLLFRYYASLSSRLVCSYSTRAFLLLFNPCAFNVATYCSSLEAHPTTGGIHTEGI
jgi:hypothetical protein